jgi:hypothetical protein
MHCLLYYSLPSRSVQLSLYNNKRILTYNQEVDIVGFMLCKGRAAVA